MQDTYQVNQELTGCLYNLEPIGIGTPYVEGLTSYIVRLADAHCVTTGTLNTIVRNVLRMANVNCAKN